MKITNMTSGNGREVPNQFIIFTPDATYFQSYKSIICKTCFENGERKTYLDETYWDYSKTTGKYLNKFLGVSGREEIRKRIKAGQYILADLNNELEA